MEYLQYIKGQTPPIKLSERYIKKHYKEFYNFLTNNYPKDLVFSEKLYWFYNNIHEYPICPVCGNRVKFNGFTHGYYQYCSLKCSNNSSRVKLLKQQTTIDNYGSIEESYKHRMEKAQQTTIDNYGSIEESYKHRMEKTKKTNLEKYGEELLIGTDDFLKKSNQTLIEKYGSIQESYKHRMEKTKKTNLKKYGVPCSLQSNIVKEKSRQTMLERYGVENSSQNKESIEKRKQTCLKRYGVECGFQSNIVKEKFKQTMLERYGVEYAQQSNEIKNKSKQTIKTSFLNSHNNITNVEYGDETIYTCKCDHPSCNKCKEKQFKINAEYYWVRNNNNIELCTNLLPIQTPHSTNTSIEIFIKLILDKYNIEYITNDREILDGHEIDIYIPSRKLAIECNGIYWHSTKNKDKRYHYNKFLKCREKGIQLLSIWEDQIINKPEIIESIILSKLGIYEKRIMARKCKIKEVNAKDTKIFLENNHLQGNVNSSIKIGLYYNDKLVSIMTFGKSRKCLNSLNNGYELYRFCNERNTQIIGGASRLFKYFLKTYNPSKVSSFASNDISNGGLYDILGFKLDSMNFGSYWYIDKKMNRYHRYNFRKSELIKKGHDSEKSESEIMNELGYYCIFDSGQTKFIYNN